MKYKLWSTWIWESRWYTFFCDDTAFVAENPAMMDKLLDCYKTFIVRWRIRVNPGKCKVMHSERAKEADIATHLFGDTMISHVKSLKYLGYWIGRAGRTENDKHIIAQATQLRFKIRAASLEHRDNAAHYEHGG